MVVYLYMEYVVANEDVILNNKFKKGETKNVPFFI